MNAPDPAAAAVTLCFPGDPADPTSWSGIPSGLGDGLDRLGADVRLVSAGLPSALDRGNLRAPELRARLNSFLLARRLRGGPRADLMVQIASSYDLPAGVGPSVTFEDMTVVQAIALGHPAVSVLSESALRKWRDRQRRAYERALACCAASAWAARSIVRDYGIPPERVRVVGFGRNHAPKAVERDWSRPRFLWVGREWERKGGPDVVEAFAELRREVPEARLDLVGEHPPLAEDGVEGHGPLGLERPDERARLERLYEAATCFVMPSRYEPFGIVHVEAAAAGIPSIGTSVGGPAQVIGTDAGRIVDPGDRPALVRALTELSHAETAAGMGAAAMRRSDLFTWEAVAARVLRAGHLPASEVDHPELEWELDPRHGVAAERDPPPELGRRAVGDRPER